MKIVNFAEDAKHPRLTRSIVQKIVELLNNPSEDIQHKSLRLVQCLKTPSEIALLVENGVILQLEAQLSV